MGEQLGLISAVLGGFAFTFLGAILSKEDKRKIIDLTFLLGVIAAVIFFSCALGWSLISDASREGVTATLSAKHRFLSLLFISGNFILASCLGLSGWIRSKRLGLLTSIVGVLGIFIIIYILKDFIT